MDALDWYSRQWGRRRNIFRWIEARAATPLAEITLGDEDDDTAQVNVVGQDPSSVPNMDEFHEMPDFEEIPEELPEVIPEAFLWTVFDQLVDAFAILGNGGDNKAKDEKWKEIVHSDVHLQNIFVKKHENATGNPLPPDPKDGDDKFV